MAAPWRWTTIVATAIGKLGAARPHTSTPLPHPGTAPTTSLEGRWVVLGRGHRFLSMGSPTWDDTPRTGRPTVRTPAADVPLYFSQHIRQIGGFRHHRLIMGCGYGSRDRPLGGHRVPSPPYKRTRPWRPALSGYKPHSAGRHGSARVSTSSETIQNWRVGAHRSTRIRSERHPRSKSISSGPSRQHAEHPRVRRQRAA